MFSKIKDNLIDIIFLVICWSLAITITIFLLNPLLKKNISLKDNAIWLIAFIVGLVVLPFASKIKIVNFEFEKERIWKTIKEIKIVQYLGEVIRDPNCNLYFYDSEGLHKVDNVTADFLKSNKGEISISQKEFDEMKPSFNMDSVLSSEIVKCTNDIFIILNGKKYYISSMSFIYDWGRKINREIYSAELKKYPLGR